MGEGGAIGSVPALINAVGDALAPLGVVVKDQPLGPARSSSCSTAPDRAPDTGSPTRGSAHAIRIRNADGRARPSRSSIATATSTSTSRRPSRTSARSWGRSCSTRYVDRPSPFDDMVQGPGPPHPRAPERLVGHPRPQHPRPGDRDAPPPAPRAARRVRHRLHVLYPTRAFGIAGIDDDDLRIGVCRGFNDFFADTYGPFADRMTPVGVIPMHTPDEAVAELEHCHELGPEGRRHPRGRRCGRSPSRVEAARPGCCPASATGSTPSASTASTTTTRCGPGSASCGFAAIVHGGLGRPAPFTFTSITSFVSTTSATSPSAMQPALQVAVPRRGHHPLPRPEHRVPRVRRRLGLHAAVRHRRALGEAQPRRAAGSNLDPALVDWDQLEQLVRRARRRAHRRRRRRRAAREPAGRCRPRGRRPTTSTSSGASGIEREARHPRPVRAPLLLRLRGRRPHGRLRLLARQRLRRQAPADPQLRHQPLGRRRDGRRGAPTPTRWCDKGILDADQYEDFVCRNPLRLFTGANPEFFDGTAVESYARQALARPGSA